MERLGALSRGALNRATLARQMLLARQKMKPVAAIERLVGLQAQLPRPPFIGLWSRIDGFRREDLIRAIERGEVVRATMMRGTLHLMSRRDYVKLRATLQPMLTLGMQSILRGRMKGIDVEDMLADARPFFKEPHTFDEFRKEVGKGDERAIAYAVRLNLPLIQVPSDARWGYSASAVFTRFDDTLAADDPQALVLRYLAAFGPASINDMQTWSGLRALRESFEVLRPKLVTFQDARGKELFDLSKAPRPDEDVDAPVRFLPEYDNLLLGHADRTRIVAEEYRSRMFTANLAIPSSFLVDGFVAGLWKIARKKKTATLEIQPFGRLSRDAKKALTNEGERLVRFVEEDASDYDIHFTAGTS